MNLDRSHIYLIGVGGIGMSALARYFKQMGKSVSGYDQATTKLTKQLQSEGIGITDFNEADAIPHPYRDKDSTLVIYTPAIPSTNALLSYFKAHDFEIVKRAEVLGELSKELPTIAVAGTHGKTTVSSMIAFILNDNDIKVNAFLGGISRDFGTNLVLNEDATYVVTEADEFDRSFLKLNPQFAVVTSLDADHLDIYSDANDLKNTFSQFTNQLPSNGELFSKPEFKKDLKSKANFNSYSLNNQSADFRAQNISVKEGAFYFDLQTPDDLIENIKSGLAGLHNIENAVVAAAIALKVGLTVEQIKASIGKFQGVKRRFDIHLKTEELVYIDDYAHHPQEIKALLSSVRDLYPNKKITTVFQPHLYSRTKDFAQEFANELAVSDELILLEIYPAREEPIEGVNSRWLSQLIKRDGIPICQKSQLMNILKDKKPEVLLTVGAGDIDTLVEPIIDYYG